MRKTIGFPSLLLVSSVIASAQQPATRHILRTAPPQSEPAMTTELPVTRVSLYKNGVGFFEHSGHVTGDQSVTIDFTTAQLNDVLQSLTAIDLNGGHIAGADYNSTTPLEQQLKSLALGLPQKTTYSALLNTLRGARVQVTGSGSPFTGRIVDVEMHKTGDGKDADGMTEGRFLTVASDSGEVRIFRVSPSISVRLLDTGTGADLTQYLKVLDSNRDQSLRHLTIEDNGTGTRELHVSYISEVPIWKSTYRILFTEPKAGDNKAQTATLQGWSVVDNTTGADWINVHLSLIAGAPQSFIQPLSVPYYSRRPEIPLPQEAQLTPQTHESGESNAPAPVMATGTGYGSMGSAMMARAAQANSGIYAGTGQTNLNENYVNGIPISGADQSATVADQTYQNLATASTVPGATTAKFDDYFAYNLTQPITIRKNQSALVPTLQTKIDAERVTLWSPSEPVPLRALWITNTSDYTLDRGSFSIIEGGNFAGEGLLDPIHPAEKRLLSYAVDQAIRVSTDSSHNTHRIVSISIAKGVLKQSTLDVSEVEYVIHNAATDPRSVVIEQPLRSGWTIDSDPKPLETTPTVARFRAEVQPGETVRLHIGQRHPGANVYLLAATNDNQINFILRQSHGDAAIQQALEPILDARRNVADVQAQVDQANALLTTLHSTEARQRENITALANADKASRDRFIHDLNTTEDQIDAAQKNLNDLQSKLQVANDDLANKIAALQIDEKI